MQEVQEKNSFLLVPGQVLQHAFKSFNSSACDINENVKVVTKSRLKKKKKGQKCKKFQK